jgi:hypothetical protein
MAPRLARPTKWNEFFLTDIDANHGNCTPGLLGYGAFLVFGAPSLLLTVVVQENRRTIPVADIGLSARADHSSPGVP